METQQNLGIVGQIRKDAFEDSPKGGGFFKPELGVLYEVDFKSIQQVEAELKDGDQLKKSTRTQMHTHSSQTTRQSSGRH